MPGARGATTRWPKRSRRGISISRSSTSSRRSSPQPRQTGDARRRRHPAAASRVRVPGDWAARQGDCRVRRARKLAPTDPAIAGYLIEANIAAKKYAAAIDAAKSALTQHPNDLRSRGCRRRRFATTARPTRALRCSKRRSRPRRRSDRLHLARAGVLRGGARRQAVKVLQDAQGSSRLTMDRVRARIGVRQAEEIRRGGVGVPPGAVARPGQRDRAELPGLHARRARRASRRVGDVFEEGAAGRAREPVVSRQPRLGLLQGRQARSGESNLRAPPTSSRRTP
jgi:hypothetical protein